MISIIPLYNINFSSTCVKEDVCILKKNELGEYTPYNAKLVEFDIKHESEKIKSICEKEEFSSFGGDLYNSLYDVRDYYNSIEKKHCFALIENSETNLTDIDKDKVLGIYTLYETTNKDIPLSLPYFMTNDNYQNQYDINTKYKCIGKSMFKSITEMYPDKAIYGYTAWSAMSFWEKLGFKHLSERRLVYIPSSIANKIKLNLYM